MIKKTKVVVLYRVLQEWRRPIFERLAKKPNIDFHLVHGPDFHNSKVVSSKKDITFKRTKLFSFKIRKESKNGLIAIPVSPFLFFKLIYENPKVVISEGASNLFNSLIGFLYAKLFFKKYIWWSLGKLEGTVHTGFRKKLDILIQFIEKKSDAIISYSTLGKEYFKSIGIDEEKIFVAVNVVDTESKKQLQKRLTQKDYQRNYDFQVLYVGALTKQKNLNILLSAFKKLENKSITVGLVIVGDGPERANLKQLSKDLEINNILFVGKVFDGVEKFFLGSDIFVLPGLGGLAVSEALAYGLPVIASRGDGCEKDLITSGVNGVIDPNLDEDSLYTHLLDLLNHPLKLKEFKNQATKTIEIKFNIHTYIENVIKAVDYVTKT